MIFESVPPMTIIEGTLIDLNLHFRVTHGGFVQTYEGLDKTVSLSTTDAITLVPCGNFQGGIRCFSVVTGRVLQRTWSNGDVCKMTVSAIKRINCIYKLQKLAKGSKFDDRQN